MDAHHDGEGYPNSFYCPITTAIMRDPVMDREGHRCAFTAVSVLFEHFSSLCAFPRIFRAFSAEFSAKHWHSYERSAIESWLNRKKTSPVTRSPLRPEDLTPNRALKEAIEAA